MYKKGDKAELKMKKDQINIEQFIQDYKNLKSSYKVAEVHGISATYAKILLRELGVMRTQKLAHKEKDISHLKNRKVKEETRKKLSDIAKKRTGEKNSFYGKKHTSETKNKLSENAKKRTGELNPNYVNGEYVRRPRDFKNGEFKPVRNYVFNRDKHTCQYCNTKGGHLHAHHKIPYWVCQEAFYDTDNIVTVCSECHKTEAHKGNWQCFDVSIISDVLISKYSLDRERLNELASKFYLKR